MEVSFGIFRGKFELLWNLELLKYTVLQSTMLAELLQSNHLHRFHNVGIKIVVHWL